METKSNEMDLMLMRWARWKQSYVIGLLYPCRTVEHKLMSGEILGSGCTGGGFDKSKSGPHFKDDPVSQLIDGIIHIMDEANRKDALILKLAYLLGWSTRKIAKHMNTSRRDVTQGLKRGRMILLSHYETFLNAPNS